MASLVSSILRAVNRASNDSLNILTTNNNETFQTDLARIGHTIYFVNHQNIRPWNNSVKQLPQNCIILSGNELKDQLKQDIQFDLVLCQNRQHFPLLVKIAKQISCPLIMAENELSDPGINPFVMEAMANQAYNISVFGSEFLANSWGFDVSDDDIFVVPPGIDTDRFHGWVGGDGKILTMVDHYTQRNTLTGFDVWSQVTNGLPVNPRGYTDGLSKPPSDMDERVSLYQNCSVFLNTSSWIACPLELLEAMAVGCPVVSTATTIIPEIITDGINGYISHENGDLRQKLIHILENPDEAKKVGENARQTIIDMFGIQAFVDGWTSILEKAVGLPSCAITEET